MDDRRGTEKDYAEMLSRCLVELADLSGHMLTILDLMARILARLEQRGHDEIVDEINELLRVRRRSSIADIEEWVTGRRTSFEDES